MSDQIIHSHPTVICVLTKLFNLFIWYRHILVSFGRSYTVPIPKRDGHCRALSVDDFRGILISPVISNLFEMAILDRFSVFFDVTCDNQFGFKKTLSCRHAVCCVRHVVDSYVNNGPTLNVCALNLSKAFDCMNHHALFIKLMERKFTSELLFILETWFRFSVSCVRWGTCFSNFFSLSAGVRQGGVLSPYFFAVFVDDIVYKVQMSNIGCYISSTCGCIYLYADDILLLAPTVAGFSIY